MKLQKKTVYRRVNDTTQNLKGRLLYEDFLDNADQRPDAIAVSWIERHEWQHMTYKALKQNALYVAGFLQRKGIVREEPVGVSLERGVDQIIAVLGVLLAGGCYVPIGIHHPLERRQKICWKADIRYVISSQNKFLVGVACIHIPTAIKEQVVPVCIERDVHELAYIIFTSGTTGEAKGVKITHDGAYNTIAAVNSMCNIGKDDSILCISDLNFDLSVYDIFGLLSAGGRVVAIPEEKSRDAVFWTQTIQELQVTIWNSVPALFDMLLTSLEGKQIRLPLQTVLVSGDWVRPQLIHKAYQMNRGLHIYALGGATEASIWSNYYKVDELKADWRAVPYGVPLPNQQLRIVDDEGVDCPLHQVGNIWIGGRGVAKGYLGDAELSRERFVVIDEVPWYCTGDIGRYIEDEVIEFMGRKDRQIKLNGHRIEMGEVECGANQLSGVAYSFAILVKSHQRNQLALLYMPEVGQAEEKEFGLAAFEVERDKAVDQAIAEFMLACLAVHSELRERQSPIISAWEKWLHSHTFKHEHVHAELARVLKESQAAIVDTLLGKRDAFWLLQHPYLSIEELFFRDNGISKGMSEVLAYVNHQKNHATSKLRIAFLDMGGQMVPDFIIQQTKESANGEFVFIMRNPSDGKRLKEKHKNTQVVIKEEGLIPSGYEFYFDIVITLNTMHQYKQPRDGVALAYGLLKPQGELMMLEQMVFPSIGYVSSLILENGFEGYVNRSCEGSPMLAPAEWGRLLQHQGFDSLVCRQVEDTATVLIRAKAKQQGNRLLPVQLRERLQGKLAQYMVPEMIRMIYAVGLSSNGKVNMSILENMLTEQKQQEIVPPVGEFETKLAALWEEILEIKQVGRDLSFFQLGGDSLLATKFLNRVSRNFNVSYALGEMFQNPILKDMAKEIEKRVQGCVMEEGEI